ncbi:F-box protein SKP2A-like protein [Hordeum vulgare]|nr:F-box protein SKP2A-like protein [Hordeum vulgare]
MCISEEWLLIGQSVIFRCQDHMNELVISLAHKFPKLQVLSLRQIKPQLEDDAVEAVANSCHDLHELDLSRSFRLSDRSLYALAHGCPHLTRLNISGCSNFSDAALIYLTSQCKNLKCLNLCGCVRAATDRALQVLKLRQHALREPLFNLYYLGAGHSLQL